MFSHQVNGTGPLAGLYQLTNSEEPRCKYDTKYYFPVAFFYQGWLRIHQCLWRSLLLWDPWKRWIWDKVVFFFICELNFPRYDNDLEVLWLNQLQCGLCSSLLPMWNHLPLTKRGPSVFAPCTITSWLTYHSSRKRLFWSQVDLYEECGSQCQMVGLPCNGSCPSGTFLCGEVKPIVQIKNLSFLAPGLHWWFWTRPV